MKNFFILLLVASRVRDMGGEESSYHKVSAGNDPSRSRTSDLRGCAREPRAYARLLAISFCDSTVLVSQSYGAQAYRMKHACSRARLSAFTAF